MSSPPLVYASPLWLSPPMRGGIFPPKNVHMHHIEMTIHIGILPGVLSPFCHE